MVNEVSKLIYNALIKHQALYLPEVGTLSVERLPANMGSKNELIQPRYVVQYASDNRAKSLIDIISNVAAVDEVRANEIYSRWLDKARGGSVVVIDRVGTLRDDRFMADSVLIEALNIHSQPLRVSRRKSSAPIYIVLALLIIAALGYCGWWYFTTMPVSKSIEVSELVELTTETQTIEIPSVTEIEDTEIEEIESVETETIIEDTETSETTETIADWRKSDDIRHWVVVGSYSTTQNAERAISDITKRHPDMQCTYYRLGKMYAVVIFGSADKEECQQYKRRYSKMFPQSWVHTPRKFR